MNQANNSGSSIRRSLRTILLVVLIVIVYAYAVDVTDIDLNEPLEPQRQSNLIGLIRELARPDILTSATETRSMDISIRMPCPEEVRGSQITVEGRQVQLVPNCATTTQDVLTLLGEGFPANVRGLIRWYPPGATTPRNVAEFRANADGVFQVSFTMPDVRETDEPQRMEIVEVLNRRISGFSSIFDITVERMIETILMAFIASTIGTILAVPISFLAARNLMAGVTMPLASIAAAVIALPVGSLLGGQIASWLMALAAQVTSQTIVGVGVLAVTVALVWPVLTLGSLLRQEQQAATSRFGAGARVAIFVLLLCFSLALLAYLGLVAGDWLEAQLGIFGFVGYFIFVLADFTRVFLPALVGFIGAVVAASYASRYGQEAIIRLDEGPARLLTLLLTITGTALFVFGVAYALNWICFLGMCRQLPQDLPAQLAIFGIPALITGIIVGAVSWRWRPKRPIGIGNVVYNFIRGTLNVLRSIEPVIMGFVFVVWVGIGPFAGVLVLILHSIADLGKLFSEQVENIAEGPLEAVTATGANRLQTIVYAVIPQIVPHYIAFAFYRWDINVRMSTIIGFVGGGGIGLVLQRSTNLTRYREASVMVIAIALVVIVLDYVSARVRSRII